MGAKPPKQRLPPLPEPEYASPRVLVAVVGDTGVGKSSLMLGQGGYDESWRTAFQPEKFLNEGDRSSNFGNKIYQKVNEVITFPSVGNKGLTAKCEIYEQGGYVRRGCSGTLRRTYAGVHCVWYVFDITDDTSFANVQTWQKEVERYGNDVPHESFLVGNKYDKRADCSPYILSDIEEYVRDHGMWFITTSAVTRHNVALLHQLTALTSTFEFNYAEAGRHPFRVKNIDLDCVYPPLRLYSEELIDYDKLSLVLLWILVQTNRATLRKKEKKSEIGILMTRFFRLPADIVKQIFIVI